MKRYPPRLWMLLSLVAVIAVPLGIYSLLARHRRYAHLQAFHTREWTRDASVGQYWSAKAAEEDASAEEERRDASDLEALGRAVEKSKRAVAAFSGVPTAPALTGELPNRRRRLIIGLQKIATLHGEAAAQYHIFAERARVSSEYHRRLANKYRRAASRPWLPIEADGPAPP